MIVEPQETSQQGPSTPMTTKVELVGRADELDQLLAHLDKKGDRHAFYLHGEGGLGKTRLLEELQKRVKEKGPGYLCSGIIDLYHTDAHSITNVQLAIMDGLDPTRERFRAFRERREKYLARREEGADPLWLEDQRKALTDDFLRELADVALEARKVVLCFDTVEQLQYQSTAVEDRARVDWSETIRLKPWLMSTLPQLANVLIVLAGRPHDDGRGGTPSAHARFLEELRRAFRSDLTEMQLGPFELEEMRAFVASVAGAKDLIPDELVPVLHRLARGRPIFLHLALDLIVYLHPIPQEVLRLIAGYASLLGAEDGDPRWTAPRAAFETKILESIFNDAGTLGSYLGDIALLPKGVNEEIICEVFGLPTDEARWLLETIRPLSFVKEHAPVRDGERLLFLQDEMYALLNRPRVMRNLRMQERRMAHSVTRSYYEGKVEALAKQIREETKPGVRAEVRREWERLQVDRLYYLLVQDPRAGYSEYKQLSDRANRERRVGFAMRLRDEFMRFYSQRSRRDQFDSAKIDERQIERETVMMWVERYHWWARHDDVIELAERILKDPQDYQILEADVGVEANIRALLTRNRQMRHGPEVEPLNLVLITSEC